MDEIALKNGPGTDFKLGFWDELRWWYWHYDDVV